ncbi:CsxC family protein [Halobacillus litoralis]|uniref:CsxC family protein n=1 Tax=Halobacillus litoralis TaxID=45668 RepID=UPI001CFF15BA|nr:hypothetical protein [Halobacillus litoralis]
MRKNTGCGQGHKKCPPMPDSDRAKSKSVTAETASFFQGTEEITRVLGDVFIQSLVEADIELPSYARAIKNIEKNVYLTQCKAIPVVGSDYVKLFVEGYVHKNIQYVEHDYGYVKDYSVNIPFKAYDKVQVGGTFPTFYSVKDNILQYRELAKDGMGADRCEFGSLTFEINNEPIKCKLLASAINQLDIAHHFDNWGRFNKITEKMDLNLLIKLTQKQQTFGVDNGNGGDEPESQASNSAETAYDLFKKNLGL